MNRLNTVDDLERLFVDGVVRLNDFERRLSSIELTYQQGSIREEDYCTAKRIPIKGESYYIDADGDIHCKDLYAESCAFGDLEATKFTKTGAAAQDTQICFWTADGADAYIDSHAGMVFTDQGVYNSLTLTEGQLVIGSTNTVNYGPDIQVVSYKAVATDITDIYSTYLQSVWSVSEDRTNALYAINHAPTFAPFATKTLSAAYSINNATSLGSPGIAGFLTSWYGINNTLTNIDGTLTTGYMRRSKATVSAGTLTTLYHDYIEASTGTIGTEWVYFSANSGNSALLGNLMIGSNTAPTSKLDLYGASGAVNLTITSEHATGTPGIRWRTDNPATQKWICGVRTDDSWSLESGVGALGTRNDLVMTPTSLSTSGYINSGTYYYINGTRIISVDGTNNVFFGALAGNTYACDNTVCFGYAAGRQLAAGGQYNVCIGGNAADSLTTGDNNVALGQNSLFLCSTTTDNTAVGRQALYGTTGGYNLGLGSNAGFAITSGTYSIAIGYNAMANGTYPKTGTDNIGIGALANERLTSANYCVAVGNYALRLNQAGANNTALGYLAGYSTTTGASLFLGYCAGMYETAASSVYLDTIDRGNLASGQAYSLMYGVTNAAMASQFLRVNGNLGLGTHSFGANSVSVLGIANGTAPAAAVANEIQIYSVDSSDAAATLGLMLEQAVEDIGTFTPSHKIKVKINGTEYWLQLDAV